MNTKSNKADNLLTNLMNTNTTAEQLQKRIQEEGSTEERAPEESISVKEAPLENQKAKAKLSNYFSVNQKLYTAPKRLFLLPVGAIILLFVLGSAGILLVQNLPKKTDDITLQETTPLTAIPGEIPQNEAILGALTINIPAEFQGASRFLDTLQVEGVTTFNDDIIFRGQSLDLGSGTITSSNVIYSITGEGGISISGGQNPVITNNDPGSAQNIFKTFTIGDTSITAGSNTDTLTFAAGTGVTLTTNTGTKTITISGSQGAVYTASNGLSMSDTEVQLGGILGAVTTINTDTYDFNFTGNGNVGIGTSAPTAKLHLSGDQYIDGSSTVTNNVHVAGSLEVTGGTVFAPTTDGTTTLTLRSAGALGNILDVTNQAGDTSYLSIDANGALTVGGSTLTNAGILESGGAIKLTNSTDAVVGTAIEGGWTLGDNTFTYRRGITTTNTSASQTVPVGHEVTLSLSGTTASDVCSHSRSDSNDIRISDGSNEIARNITRSCTTSVVISFQLTESISASGSDTYYLYYNNEDLEDAGSTYSYESLTLDTADDATDWVSSDSDELALSQEATITQEGTGSVQLDQVARPISLDTLSTTNQTQLPAARYRHGLVSATINGTTYVYMVGGSPFTSSYTNTVYKATIDESGNISNWTTTNQAQFPVTIYQQSMFTATVGSSTFIYVLAGNGGSGTYLTVYKAQIDENGNVGSWSTSGQGQLPSGIGSQNMNGVATVTISGTTYVYFAGGFGPSSLLHKATIDANGNISTWTTANQTQLPAAMWAQALRSISVGGNHYLYTIGGNVGGSFSTAVYKAQIDESGNVGSWTTSGQGQLPQNSGLHDALVFTDGTNYSLYVLGGYNGSSNYDSIYKASVDSNGNIGTFSTTNQAQLPTAMREFRTFYAQSNSNYYLYVIGGRTSTPQTTVYRGSISSPSFTTTKTISSTDLSNKGGIQFKIYSSRVGSYMSFEFSNDGGSTWETKSFSISSANTWEIKTLDITDVANADKDTVTRIRFTVTDSATAFTAYFDDIKAIPSPFTDTAPTLVGGSAILGSADLTLNAQGSGIIKLNYDATNSLAGTGGLNLYDGGDTSIFSVSTSGLNFYNSNSNPLLTISNLGTLALYDNNQTLLFDVNGSGNASASGSLTTGTGILQTINNQTLTLGGDTTGDVIINDAIIKSNDNIVFQILTTNTLVGELAGSALTSGGYNTLLGHNAGKSTTGNYNSFMGYQAGYANTSGVFNTFLGYRSGYTANTNYNTFLGYESGLLSTAPFNTFLGTQAGRSSTGSYNTFTGYQAGYANTSGSNNSFFGNNSGRSSTNGHNNLFLGYYSGYSNISGSNNVFLGSRAGYTTTTANANTTGSNNTFLGYGSGPGTTTQLTNAGAIGYSALVSQSNSLVLGGTGVNAVSVGVGTEAPIGTLNIEGSPIGKALVNLNYSGTDQHILTASSSGITKFVIDNSGNVGIGTTNTSTSPLAIAGLGTSTGTVLVADENGNIFLSSSSERYKENIQSLNTDFNKLLELDAKSYNYKHTGAHDIGFLAEDLDAKGLTDLVIYDKNGQPDAIKYDRMTVYLSAIAKEQKNILEHLQESIKANEQQIASISASIDELTGLKPIAYTLLSASDGAPITKADGDLVVMGTVTSQEVSLTDSLTIGNSLHVTSSSINTIGEELQIQSLQQGALSFMADALRIETDGTVTFAENVSFEKDITVKGTATVQNIAVPKVTITNLSDTEIVASTSAGTTFIKSGKTIRKIYNHDITTNSLIYVTAVSDTQGQAPYILEQNETTATESGSFTVKINAGVSNDLHFNFLIINQKD